MNTPLPVAQMKVSGKLVCAQQLLEQLFDPGARPSVRWLRTQTKSKSIPHVRIGHLVFFDVEMVRATLAAKNLVRGKLPAGYGVAVGNGVVNTGGAR